MALNGGLQVVLIAHMADIHLGYAQYGLSERERDIYETFEEAVELVMREHADILLIAGDLFDAPKPSIKALINARKLLKELRDNGVEIYHVIGDHEIPRRVDDLPPTALLEAISTHVGLRNIKLGGDIMLTGLDRIRPSMREEALKELEGLAEDAKKMRKRIMLAHAPLRGPENIAGKLPSGYSYYALGHEHVRKIFSIGGAVAAYPGSIEILSTAEVEAWRTSGKGFLLVDLSGEEPIIHEVNLGSIRPQRVVETDVKKLEKALQDLVEWASGQSKKPVVHLRIRGRSVDRQRVLREIQEMLSRKALHYRYEIIEEAEEIERVEEAPRIDLRSMIREYMLAKGFGEEDVDLAISIYEAFASKGIEEVEKLILKQAGEDAER